MLGQVRQALVIDGVKHQMLELHNADLKKRGKKPLPLQACRRWYYKHFPVDFTEAEADWFLKHIGTKAWEKKYGVMIDKTYREMKGDHK